MRETSGDVAAWPDPWLIAAVRRDPPDEAALDALADRYWRPLFGRCRLVTLNQEKASDLAQEAWCRVLRARHRLDPEGNFPAYLAATAMNIWRDWHRSARRAGPMADHRLASLDAAPPGAEGRRLPLAEAVPDLASLDAEERNALKLDIDEALGRLSPRSREVLVARFLAGESCADIGRRHGRTEQTISSWVRQALEEMRQHLQGEKQESGGNDG
jgi:RNA polymerase sigma factor (sigma-70 family)